MRPAMTELIEAAVCGDVVVMCRLYRLGRSLAELLELVEDLAGGVWDCGRWASRSTPQVPQDDWCCTCSGPLAEFGRSLMRDAR